MGQNCCKEQTTEEEEKKEQINKNSQINVDAPNEKKEEENILNNGSVLRSQLKASNEEMVESKNKILTDEEKQRKKNELYGSTFEKSTFVPQYNFPAPN